MEQEKEVEYFHHDLNNTVTQHNKLVRSRYSLTLSGKRLLMLAQSKINPQLPFNAGQQLAFKIHASDYKQVFDVKNPYAELKKACRDLGKCLVWLSPTKFFGWVDVCEYLPHEGAINIKFTPSASEYLSGLTTEISTFPLKETRHMRKFYSIRLYEMLMQFKNTGWMKISLDDLQKALEVNYSLYSAFNRYVLKNAIAEINEKSNIDVLEIKLIKAGRKVVGFHFFFSWIAETESIEGDFEIVSPV